MILRTAVFLIPALLLAQTTPADAPKPAEPPSEVDQALRARVKDFLQYSMEGNYRKVFELVAEGSKDFYFGMPKPKNLDFDLASITYSDNFTKAVVKGSSKRIVPFNGHDVEIPLPFYDTWQVEDGKWMWVHQDVKVLHTPLGDVPLDPNEKPAQGAASALPKDMSESAVRTAEKQLQVPTSISKELLSFTNGKAGSEELVFHNGVNGFVRVLATPIFDGGAFRAEPSEVSVAPGKDVTFVVRYDPSAGKPIGPSLIRFTVEPFDKVYVVPLRLIEPAAQ